MIRSTLALALVAASAAVFAAPTTYTIDSTHTYAAYEVNHLGLSLQSGSFTKVEGQLNIDAAAKTGAVNVKIDANSLNTFLPDRDKHLKSADFFNVEKFPTLTYQSSKVVFKGQKPVEVQGQLTLLGVTRPVTLKLTHVALAKNPMSGKETYGANAVATIKRSEFGMKTFAPAISDEVKLSFVLEAIKAD